MKKILSIALAIVMVLSLGICAFADTIAGSNDFTTDSESSSVNITVNDLADGAIVYNVVIGWDSLNFTYNKGTKGVWDPGNHTYGEVSNKGWVKVVEGAPTYVDSVSANITVTNHSNAKVKSSAKIGDAYSYTADGVTVDLDKTQDLTFNAADEGESLNNPANAPSATYTVTVSGEPSTTNANFCTITVTITPAA